MSTRTVFETIKVWKEIKFVNQEPQVFKNETIIPTSLFYATTKTSYPEETFFRITEIKLVYTNIVEANSWATQSKTQQYVWKRDDRTQEELDVTLVPDWIKSIIHADNIIT